MMMMMGKCDQMENQCQIQETTAGNMSGTDGESEYYKKIDELEVKNIQSRCLEEMLSDDDDSSLKAEFLGMEADEGNELLKMVEPAAAAADSSLTSAEDWGSLDSDDMINQPTEESFQWWDFWC